MKNKYRFVILIIYMFITFLLDAQSHFDNIQWKKSKTDRNVTVYTVSDGVCNYYKAETTFKNPKVRAADMHRAINDFSIYVKVFEKMKRFKPIGQTERGLVISAVANFSPMKDRIYDIELWTLIDGNTYITEWVPYTGSDIAKTPSNGQKYITTIYGRWIFRDNPDGSLYVSNEYHNNWEYSGLSLKTVTPFEQNISVKNILALYDYVLKLL